MTIDQLISVLKVIGTVTAKRWHNVMDIVECLNGKESCEILDKSWHEKFKNDNPAYFPLELNELKTWSTYEGCSILEFSITKKGELLCNAQIWEGDNMDGIRTSLRFTAKILLPLSFLNKIKGTIEWHLDNLLDQQYEKHLELQKQLWISKLKTEILNLPHETK